MATEMKAQAVPDIEVPGLEDLRDATDWENLTTAAFDEAARIIQGVSTGRIGPQSLLTPDDLVSEVFLRLGQRFERDAAWELRGEGENRRLLGTIARNLITDDSRKKKLVREADGDEDQLRPEQTDESPQPPEVLARAEEHSILRRALGKLSPNEREVIDLSLQDLSVSEIADQLELEAVTVRYRLSRAANRLEEIVSSE